MQLVHLFIENCIHPFISHEWLLCKSEQQTEVCVGLYSTLNKVIMNFIVVGLQLMTVFFTDLSANNCTIS